VRPTLRLGEPETWMVRGQMESEWVLMPRFECSVPLWEVGLMILELIGLFDIRAHFQRDAGDSLPTLSDANIDELRAWLRDTVYSDAISGELQGVGASPFLHCHRLTECLQKRTFCCA
jgi:hypothetical protein